MLQVLKVLFAFLLMSFKCLSHTQTMMDAFIFQLHSLCRVKRLQQFLQSFLNAFDLLGVGKQQQGLISKTNCMISTTSELKLSCSVL